MRSAAYVTAAVCYYAFSALAGAREDRLRREIEPGANGVYLSRHFDRACLLFDISICFRARRLSLWAGGGDL